ncbi:MAG: spherulation-specific family 4 protein [Nitrosotalea sp.]
MAPLNGSNQWTNATNSHNAYPSVRMVAVVNYLNGILPNKNDTGFATGIINLQKAGIIVLGYVFTGYDCTNSPDKCTLGRTAPTLANVEGNMSRYQSFYHVNGTFFDEMSSTANGDNITYYGKLNNYSKYYLNETFTVGNPGDEPDSGFSSTFDNLVVWEQNATLPSSSDFATWNTNFNKNLFSVLVYNETSVHLNSTYYNSTAKHTGYLYFTDDGGINGDDISPDEHHNPWDQISTYLNSTLSNLIHN